MDKIREVRLRNWAKRLRLELHKSHKRRWSLDDKLGYMITNPSTNNSVLLGNHFDANLDEVEKYLQQYEAKLKAS
jgi:hypothetical protein